MRHPAGHDHHEFGLGELGKKGANGEWGFGLAHEDAGGNVKGFRAAGTHHASHDPSRCPDDELHHTEVIQNREERGNKNDRGQHLEGKRKAKTGEFLGQAEVAENKRGPRVGKAQQLVRAGAKESKHRTAHAGTQNEETKRQLKAEAPGDGLELNCASICGE